MFTQANKEQNTYPLGFVVLKR